MNWAGLIQRYRRLQIRQRGQRIDRSCVLGRGVSFGLLAGSRDAIQIGSGCELGNWVELNPWGGSIHLGKNVFVGPHAVIYGHGGVEVGDHSLISMHCCILSSNHTVPPRGTLIRSQPDILLPTRIGSDVWLGAGVTVLGGVTIGDGCVVGAGAVVTRDLAPYSLAIGVPARVTGTRELSEQLHKGAPGNSE